MQGEHNGATSSWMGGVGVLVLLLAAEGEGGEAESANSRLGR